MDVGKGLKEARMKLRNIHLRSAIILASIVISIIPFLVSMALLCEQAMSSHREMMHTYAHHNADILSTNVESILSGVYDATLYPLVNPQTMNYLGADREDLSEAVFESYQENAFGAISSLPYASDFIRYYILERMDGASVSTGPGYYTIDAEERARAIAMNGSAIWEVEEMPWTAHAGRKSTYVVVYRLLRDPVRVSNHLGIMKLYINSNVLQGILEPLQYFSNIQNYIVDSAGNPLVFSQNGSDDISFLHASAKDSEILADSFSRGGIQYLMYARPLKYCNWRLVTLMPNEYIDQYMAKLWRIMLAALCLFLAISVVMMLIFSNLILKPLRSIGGLMRSVGEENYAVRTEISGPYELAQLQNSFNEMTGRLAHLHNESYIYNIKLRDAQIKELQTRINPHFLYNTLNSIYWMSTLNHLDELSLMVSSLSSLLRISLSTESDGLIPFRTECMHVHYYITIQQIRFRDSIEFIIDHEEGLEKYRVFPLILQPLIENAITHGVEPMGGGTIRVQSRRRGDYLEYIVQDNGIGMDARRFEAIIHAEENEKSSGMAPKNIHDRLILKYGNQYGLTYQPAVGGGSLFIVTQPLQEAVIDA